MGVTSTFFETGSTYRGGTSNSFSDAWSIPLTHVGSVETYRTMPRLVREISKECAEAQALSKALNEEMLKVEEKRRKAKADAASLAEVMSLRISDKRHTGLNIAKWTKSSLHASGWRSVAL